MAVGTQAPAFALPATDGKTYDLSAFSDATVLVVIFTCNHCPYAKACEDRLIALQHDYANKGVRLVAINPNNAVSHPEDSFEAMKVRAQEKQFNFPYLRDESQEVARAYDAACTPDIFVFDAQRKLVYNGRIDDNWQDERKVTARDLARAIECVLARQPLTFKVVPSMGCSIKWV